jgi:hypothetical protein
LEFLPAQNFLEGGTINSLAGIIKLRLTASYMFFPPRRSQPSTPGTRLGDWSKHDGLVG